MVLFIDTDPGTDDIMALIYLLKYSDQQVIGMSSVSGNLDIDVTTRNLRLIAGYFKETNNLEIEIFKGASQSLVNVSAIDGSTYHGLDGCGNFFSSNYYKKNNNDINRLIENVKISNFPAAMGLIEVSKKYKGELVIITLGPLTNVALAQIIDSDFGSRIKEILIMGGDIYGHGNSDQHLAAEFNFNKDPEAAYVVLKEMSCKKTILPLEPNFQVAIPIEIASTWIEKLEGRPEVLSNIMLSILKFHCNKYPSLELYDLMLALIFTDPDIISEIQLSNVVVELEGRYTRGKVVFDQFNKCDTHAFQPFRPVNVVKTMNKERIIQILEKMFE